MLNNHLSDQHGEFCFQAFSVQDLDSVKYQYYLQRCLDIEETARGHELYDLAESLVFDRECNGVIGDFVSEV